MLILSRKSGEVIRIGDDIEISVMSTKNDQVKIGIKAPKHVEVYRKEIYEQILAENKRAALETIQISTFTNKNQQNY